MKTKRYGQAAILSARQWRKIKRNSEGWFKVLVYVAYLTGERWGAICQLRVEDVYTSDGNLKENITFRVGTRKGKDRTRQVPVHPDLKPVLLAWKPSGEWLFPAPRNPDIPVSLRTADNALRLVLAKAGLSEKGISTHSTRRTFITNLHRKGIDIYTIAQITGHRSLKALTRYIQNDPKRTRNALEVLTA